MYSAAAEARFSRLMKYSVTSESESELAESSDEEPSPDEEGRETRTMPGNEWASVGLQLPRGPVSQQAFLSQWTGCDKNGEGCGERK